MNMLRRPGRVAVPQASVSYKPSLSTLPLQVSLFYNALYSLIFTVLMGAVTINKVMAFDTTINIVVLALWFLAEPIRLYYGFSGNLGESVPHLSTFLLMTVFPQMPFVIYLAYIQVPKYPIDAVIGSFMMIFLAFEFIFGLYTIRQVIRSQTAQFMQLVEQED